MPGPNQKKPTDPTQAQPTDPTGQNTEAPSQPATPSQARVNGPGNSNPTPPAQGRPSNPPIPGTGPNGPTNPQATPAVPTSPPPAAAANPSQQYQGSGFVGGQRYMDLLGPTFRDQAKARADSMASRAAAAQEKMVKASQDLKQQQLNAEIANPTDVKGFQYSSPASLKDYLGESEYNSLLSDLGTGADVGAAGSDAGLSGYLQSQGGAAGMSDLDAALYGMGTNQFGANAARYGDLLGQLQGQEKGIGDNYAKAKADSDTRQKQMLDDAAAAKEKARTDAIHGHQTDRKKQKNREADTGRPNNADKDPSGRKRDGMVKERPQKLGFLT